MGHDIEEAVENFRNAVIAYSGDEWYINGGRIYEAMRESFHFLKDLGESGNEALVRLLHDESVHVRCWIAAAFG